MLLLLTTSDLYFPDQDQIKKEINKTQNLRKKTLITQEISSTIGQKESKPVQTIAIL